MHAQFGHTLIWPKHASGSWRLQHAVDENLPEAVARRAVAGVSCCERSSVTHVYTTWYQVLTVNWYVSK